MRRISSSSSCHTACRLLNFLANSQTTPVTRPKITKTTAAPSTMLVTTSQNVRGSCMAHFRFFEEPLNAIYHRRNGGLNVWVHGASHGKTVRGFHRDDGHLARHRQAQFPRHGKHFKKTDEVRR